MHRILTPFVFLSLSAAAAAADQPAEGRARAIAPYLDDQVIAVARVDVTRLDAKAAAEKLERLHPADADTRAAFRKALADWVEAFTRAGGKELYAVVSLADLPHQPPFVIVPLEQNADARALAELLKHDPERQEKPLAFAVSEKVDGVVFAGSKVARERLRALKAANRPELAQAFAAAGDTAVQVLLVPSADVRRVVEETISNLPGELGRDAGKMLSQGVRWAAAGLDGPPRMSLRVVIQSDNADAAKKLHDWIAANLKAAAQNPGIRQRLPGVERVAANFTPELAGDRQTLTAGDATLEALVTPLVNRVGQAAGRAQVTNSLKQVALAMHNYHDVHKHFPAAASTDKQGRPLLSWRVHILPFLNEKKLYDEFHLDEPWDSEHNKKLIARMPPTYRTSPKLKAGTTTMLGVAGERAMFPGRQPVSIRDVADGTSNTVWVVVADDDRAVEWTKPGDFTYDPDKPLQGLGGRFGEGFLGAFVDGSVHFIEKSIDPKTLTALFTRNGGEVVRLP